MELNTLFVKLWEQYASQIKAAKAIHQLFVDQGEVVVNDHVAFRTFDDTRVSVDVLAKPFIDLGYHEAGDYEFSVKKLFAKHYEHEDSRQPKVFISQLKTREFSPQLQGFVTELVDQIPTELLEHPAKLLLSGRLWARPQFSRYQKLLAESEYAAWMYVFGFCANHFTVNVNVLKGFDSIFAVNKFLKANGYQLNSAGGEVKGTPQDFLEQSSIMAEQLMVEFEDGPHQIPASYYEFAKRYEDPATGKLYQGFVASSADKIFESTDTQKSKDV